MERIGARTKYGRIVAIGWIGERYYWMVGKDGTIAMMPAKLIEGLE